jgi:arylsulfatase A-like enzyme
MKTSAADPLAQRSLAQPRISPLGVIALAIACGLAGGYLDIVCIVLKKYFGSDLKHFEMAYDFPWTVPVGHVVLLALPSALLALICAIRPKPMSLRATTWLFATPAIWAALLRLPLYGVASLILAAGLATQISKGVAGVCQRPWPARLTFAGLVVSVFILAALATGWRAARDHRTRAQLASPPSDARNVILIVWDTVRANHLSLYGYDRDTTPHLKQWARKGVRYNLALASAPWTYASHSSFLTGRWPFQVNSQWKYTLETKFTTLAEYLTSRGYDTAGFAANTGNVSYESGLDRGFAHFEDYSPPPWALLSRTVPGKWILESVLSYVDLYAKKWVAVGSRGARGIDDAFLDWLSQRQPGRPFFAFMNYFDAHMPYIAPVGYDGHFGVRPKNSQDYEFLVNLGGTNQQELHARDIEIARDCYDNCIVLLDDELGRLLEELQARSLLGNTDVIITSDHGEEFGEHGTVGHNNGIMLNEVAVPLVILSPSAPAGRVVTSPVSLRDLPATVVDLLGLADRSPFPGHSLAAYWSSARGQDLPITSPALTEQATTLALDARFRRGREHPGFQISLVASGHQYVRRGVGVEQLFRLTSDPYEQFDLMKSPDGQRQVGVFRKLLLEMLTDNPGSAEVETAYLKSYREWLEALVHEGDATVAVSSVDGLGTKDD